MMSRLAVVLLAVCLMPAVPGAQTRPSPEALARSLQQRYQGVRDFSADFVHTYRGGVLRTQTTERGNVTIKKPGRMRWVYTAPEKKEFVSDGQKVYSYLPQDKQVIVASLPSDDQATTPALFLAGKGDIARDFTAAYAEPRSRATPPAKRRPEADAAAVGTRIRIPGRGGRSGDAADPRPDDARPPGGRFGPDFHESEGKPGNIR